MSKTTVRQAEVSNRFAMIPSAQIPRSVFDRSHGYKTTFDSGYLIPFYVDEVLPGDTHSLKANLFARLATPIVPFMDNVYLETFFFFVPNRLVWDHWENFMGAQDKPNASTDYLVPSFNSASGGIKVGSLGDYFGIPTGVASIKNINALPFRAYGLIYNEWFRDENLQDPIMCDSDGVFKTGDSQDDLSAFMPVRRGKFHDYFTSALPWPQKGEAVNISLGGSAPVIFASNLPVTSTGIPTFNSSDGTSGDLHYNQGNKRFDLVSGGAHISWNNPAGSFDQTNLSERQYSDRYAYWSRRGTQDAEVEHQAKQRQNDCEEFPCSAYRLEHHARAVSGLGKPDEDR